MTHDPLCVVSNGPCCPWVDNCFCQCLCDVIAEIRADERERIRRDLSEFLLQRPEV